jgi:hypothetical protein
MKNNDGMTPLNYKVIHLSNKTVRSESQIKPESVNNLRIVKIYKKLYFKVFLDMDTPDLDGLFTMILPSLEGSGNVIFADGQQSSIPALFECLLG